MYRIKIVLLILGISLDFMSHDTEVLYKQRLANFVKKRLLHSNIQFYCHLTLSVFFNLLLYSMCVCAAFGELKFLIINVIFSGFDCCKVTSKLRHADISFQRFKRLLKTFLFGC